MMKKAIAALLCAILACSILFAGCSGKNSTTPVPTSVPTEVPTEEPTPTPTATPEPTEEPTAEPTATPEPDVPEGMQILSNNNISIVLPVGFFNMSSMMTGFAACFGNETNTIIFTQETFEVLASAADDPENMNEEAYANLVIQASELDAEVVTKEGKCYFEYDNSAADDVTYHYVSFVIKGEDSFYMAQFACATDKYDEDMFANYIEWYDSISIG